ncbi:MAG: hypothetical protein KDA42_20020, partial [Planctomycetales bacterium]|nr:hypothetical protein [Planctomycetales bacterium]
MMPILKSMLPILTGRKSEFILGRREKSRDFSKKSHSIVIWLAIPPHLPTGRVAVAKVCWLARPIPSAGLSHIRLSGVVALQGDRLESIDSRFPL